MSRQLVTIRCKQNNDTILPYSYFDRKEGKNLTMVNDGRVIQTDPNQEPPEFRKAQYFNRGNREYSFWWDTNNPDDIGYIERIFLLNHPGIECATYDGNPNVNAPRFVMIDHYTEDIAQFSHLSNLSAAFNMVLSMDKKTLADVLYYFGQKPQEMSKRQMILKLIEPQYAMLDAGGKAKLAGGGILHTITNEKEFAKEFIEIFGDQSEETRRKINIQKAVALKIVEAKGDAFYMGSENVGSSMEQVFSFFASNSERYLKGLLPLVQQAPEIVESSDMDDTLESPDTLTYKPLKPITIDKPRAKWTQKDLDEIEKEILQTQNSPDYNQRQTQYAAIIASQKMKRNKIKKFLEEEQIKKNEKEAGTHAIVDKLGRRGRPKKVA